MPRHSELDFNHTAAWCDDCFDQQQRGQQIAELRRANDLKERILTLRENPQWGEFVEEKPRPTPTYALPQPRLSQPAPQPDARLRWGSKGGMNIEPASG
jgi:hypothetical protein